MRAVKCCWLLLPALLLLQVIANAHAHAHARAHRRRDHAAADHFHITAARNANRAQLRTIKLYMNENIDPCEDYYGYACGNWPQEHASADYYETIGLIDHKIDNEYARLLGSVKRRRRWREKKFVRKLLNYYRSCMSVAEYAPQFYLDWLQEHEQLVWPTPLPSSRAKRRQRGPSAGYDWLQLLAVLRKYGLNGVFIEQTVIQRQENARASVIDVDKPVLSGGFQPLSRSAYLLILEYLGVNDRQRVDALWKQLHEFELKLLNLDAIDDYDSESSADNSTEASAPLGARVVTLAELQMPWLQRYLSIVTESAELDANMNITIQNVGYLRVLMTVLNAHEPEFICRYLMLRFLWYLNIDGPRNFLKADCISHTRSMLPLAMNWLYERSHPELLEEQPNIEALFAQLLAHFTRTLHNNANRFDAAILSFLQYKIDTMRIKIGNLPRPNSTALVEQFYKPLELQSHDFYANHLLLLRHASRAKLARLTQLLPTHDAFFHLEEPETGASSSPYYLLRSNIVIVPLTLLHLPIYHPELHPVFKYSSLGFLLSHEITHGFDDSGLEFDESGNMRGPARRIKSNALFDANLNCLRGKNPQIVDEKIADVSGLRWAYEAYFKHNASNVSKQHSKPLQFTDFPAEHLFFLNFAQFFCGAPMTSARLIEFSEHGADHERVLDTLANFAEFGRFYKCPLDSRMHPAHKCQLWR